MAQDPQKSAESYNKKHVDQSWKDSIEKEKKDPSSESPKAPPPKLNFPFFVSTMAMQVLVALGEMQDPSTNQLKPEPDLHQAKYLIDIIEMLVEKTKGNLSPDEEKSVQGLLYEIRMKFVAKSGAAQ